MKKTLLFAAAVLALAACSKESSMKEEGAIDASKIVFDIKVENADATKGVKTDWQNGEVVYVFFEGNTTQYVRMVYDDYESTWEYTDKDHYFDYEGLNLTASGKKVSAVYIPGLVCSEAPTYDSENGIWSFGTVGGYYQTALSDYTVTSTADVTTLSANLSLAAPDNMIQVFFPLTVSIDMPLAIGQEYVLNMTNVIPFEFYGIAPGGDASCGNTEVGFPMTGYNGLVGGESGYYFWGVLSNAAAGSIDYQFQLVKRDKAKKYAISSISKTVTDKNLTGATAIQINSGYTVNGSFVSMGYDGGPLWATGNLGRTDNSAAISNTNYKIADPLEAGDYFQWGATVVYNTSTYNDQWIGTTYDEDGLLPKAQDVAYQVNNAWRMPTKAQFDALINSSNTSSEWVDGWTSIGNSNRGYFITSNVNGISLFFAASGLYSNATLALAGNDGGYWSSSPRDDLAYALDFNNGNIRTYYLDRTLGYSVRPVPNN